jgi:hypothetical protein
MKSHTYVVSALLLVCTLPSQQLSFGQTAGLMLIADRHAVGRPGVNVVVDAGSADQLLAYAKNPSSLVHGLVGSVAAETKLRDALLEVDQTDWVTVSIWEGKHIPFTENTVNQIVCDKVTDEVRRALARHGCVVTAGGEELWFKPYRARVAHRSISGKSKKRKVRYNAKK